MLNVMKQAVVEVLQDLEFELVDLNYREQQKDDDIILYTSLELEIPKGMYPFNGLSRKRLTVKVLERPRMEEYNLELKSYTVKLSELEISYINGKDVYFRANNYRIAEVE